MAWDLSCRDWEDRLRSSRSLVPDLPLNRDEADRAIAIFNRLKLPDVQGTPTLEEAGGQWFRDIVAAWAGSWNPVSRVREITEIFCEVPKKNAKTTAGAALMLTAMMMNRRPRAEFLLVGPTQAIAETAFNQASGMIEADPALAKRFTIQTHVKKITYRPQGGVRSTLQIKTFSAKILTGVKPVGVLIDELHELGKIAGAHKVLGQIRGGRVPFPEGFLVFITTQPDDPPVGVMRAELIKARMIRDGKAPANGLLPVLYEFPTSIIKSGAWKDSANWYMVTPNLDRSVSLATLVTDYDVADRTSEQEMRRWASQHLNLEIGISLGSDAWTGAEYWERRGDASLTLDALLDRSDVAVIGIDGGGADDLLGLAVMGRDAKTREWLLWARAWVHRDVLGEAPSDADEAEKATALKRRKNDIAPRLRDFAAQGDVVIFDEPGQDLAELADIVEKVSLSGKLPPKNAIGLDPMGVGMIVDEIATRDIDTSQEAGIVVGVTQGWKLSGAIATVGRKLRDGDIRHAAQPLMAWAVGNAKVEPKGNAIMITKQLAGRGKIDPLMAAFDAAALMALNPDARVSVYESENRGFLVL
jgi:phage terminase large subunit-like protein